MMNYGMMRCISAIAIGVLIMVWPEAAILYLVIAIGAMFFLPSLFSLGGFYLDSLYDARHFTACVFGFVYCCDGDVASFACIPAMYSCNVSRLSANNRLFW